MSSAHSHSLHGHVGHGHKILNHERAVIPSSITSVIGQPPFMSDGAPESKITLLSRPQPMVSLDQSVIGPMIPPRHVETYLNLNMPDTQLSSGAVSFTGRATRGDYFDTEDPSVNLHEFIINSMQSQKNRVILVKLEEEFVKYVQDVDLVEPLKLPPWDSYHRMLAHRVAAYFGLEHNVDPVDKMCVVVQKGPNTRLPQRRFAEYMTKKAQDDTEASEPKHILKRTKEVAEVKLETILGSSSDLSGVKSLKSYEEREEEYERARARIFSQLSPLETKEPSVVFDLETPSNLTRRKSRFLPAIMQHRRAASDTTAFLFNRSGLSDLHKEGASSDHSSPSITPLLSHLNKSTDAISRAIGSHQELAQSPVQQLSPHTPRKLSQYEHHNPVSHSPPKLSKYEPAEVPVASHNAASLQSGVPVVYQQPRALIADPNWYPYQQMMVYQVPHGYIPTPQYSPFGPTVFQPAGQLYAVNQAYPPVAGPVLAPGQDIPPAAQGGAVHRGGYEQFANPAPSAGIALVRPIPQQPGPIRVAKPVGHLGSPIHQPYAAHQPVVQPRGDQSAYAFVSYPQDVRTSQLADQMDASLHVSDGNASAGRIKSVTTKDVEVPATSQFNRPVSVMGASTSADGLYTISNATGGVTHNVVGGPVVSPTLPRGPMQLIPQQITHPLYGGSATEAAFVSPASHGSMAHYPAGFSPQASSPGQPSTPGTLNFPPCILQARPQGVFSPSNSGITHSPVQILGHTLGTSLFSPPPSGSSHPALFGQPSGKGLADAPSHPPIGSGAIPDSPGLVHPSFNGSAASNGVMSSTLPPRLVQGRPQKSGPNRYQNQRHPANRVNKTAPQDLSRSLSGEHTMLPTGRKEALLPTPPTHHMVKLDTNLTCGVPLHIMELVSFPPEGSPEILQAKQMLKDIGVKETKVGIMPKNGERIMIAIFEDPDSATKALQVKNPHFTLSIPGNNHAKFILSLL